MPSTASSSPTPADKRQARRGDGPGRALRGVSSIQRGRPTPAHRHFGSATSRTRETDATTGQAVPETTAKKTLTGRVDNRGEPERRGRSVSSIAGTRGVPTKTTASKMPVGLRRSHSERARRGYELPSYGAHTAPISEPGMVMLLALKNSTSGLRPWRRNRRAGGVSTAIGGAGICSAVRQRQLHNLRDSPRSFVRP